MKCQKCGRQMEDDASFCPNCGASFAESEAVPKPAAHTKAVIYTGPTLKSKRVKTGTDKVCGIFFLVFGIAGLILFGLLLGKAIEEFQKIFSDFSFYNVVISLWDTSGLQRLSLPLFFASLGIVFAIVASLLVTLAAFFSLAAGRGRNLAYAGLVFMLFTLFFDALTLFLMYRLDNLTESALVQLVYASILVYAFEILFVGVLMVLLAFKKLAKRKAMEAPAAPVLIPTRITAEPPVPTAVPGPAAAPPPAMVPTSSAQPNAPLSAQQDAAQYVSAEANAAEAAIAGNSAKEESI